MVQQGWDVDAGQEGHLPQGKDLAMTSQGGPAVQYTCTARLVQPWT